MLKLSWYLSLMISYNLLPQSLIIKNKIYLINYITSDSMRRHSSSRWLTGWHKNNNNRQTKINLWKMKSQSVIIMAGMQVVVWAELHPWGIPFPFPILAKCPWLGLGIPEGGLWHQELPWREEKENCHVATCAQGALGKWKMFLWAVFCTTGNIKSKHWERDKGGWHLWYIL